LKAVFSSITIYLTLLLVMFIPLKASGDILDAGWKISIEGGEATPLSFPYYKKLKENTDAVIFIKPKRSEYKTLAFLWPSVTSLEVKFNGRTIHMVGDPNNPSANIWNYFNVIELPEAPDGTDILSLHVTGLYDYNLRKAPYLEKRSVVLNRALIHNVIYNSFLLLVMGAGILTGIFLFIIAHQDDKFSLTARLLGITALLLCIYCLNFCYAPSLGGIKGFVIIKRIILIAGYGATLTFCFSLENYYRGCIKVTRFLAIPTFAAFGLIIFTAEFSQVWRLVPFMNMGLLVNLIASIYLALQGKKKGTSFLIVPFLLLFTISELIVVMFLHLSWPTTLQYVVLLGVIQFGIVLIHNNRRIYREHKKLHGEVRRDPLTGAYNRRILAFLSPQDYDLLALIDLDNFKQYNDKRGHAAGDKLLKDFVTLVKRNLRSDDLLIRYGGDEFLIIFHCSDMETGDHVFERIEKDFAAREWDDFLGFSYGIESLDGESKIWEEFLEEADSAMYRMKSRRKEA
jgi:diguanylate cyclase (GGDEF)-like protein